MGCEDHMASAKELRLERLELQALLKEEEIKELRDLCYLLRRKIIITPQGVGAEQKFVPLRRIKEALAKLTDDADKLISGSSFRIHLLLICVFVVSLWLSLLPLLCGVWGCPLESLSVSSCLELLCSPHPRPPIVVSRPLM